MLSYIICSEIKNITFLKQCIQSCRDADEIIVVVDNIQQMMDAYEIHENVTYVINDGVGLSAARNTGIKYAHGDYIGFLDDDAYLADDYIPIALDILNKHGGNIVIGGPVYPIPAILHPDLYWLIGCTTPSQSRPIGASFMTTYNTIQNVGTFRVDLGKIHGNEQIGEDTEWFGRDMTNVIDERLISYHHVSANRVTYNYLINRAFIEGTSKAKYIGGYGTAESNMIKTLISNPSVMNYTVLATTGCGYIIGKIFK